MKKIYNKLESFLNYKNLEFFSYILLILWSISPIVEYIVKKFIRSYYTHYFVDIIYLIGILGIIEYIIYVYKKKHDNDFNIKKLIPQILILVLLFLSIISSLLSEDPVLSIFGDAYRKEGLLVYIMYIGFVLMTSTIKNEKNIKSIINMIIISAIFISVVPLFGEDISCYHFSNIYHNSNHYGYFLMISCVLSGFMFIRCIGIKKIIYLLGYIILLYMLIRNDTFGCFLSIIIVLLFSFVYSLIKKNKRIDIAILIVTFILTSFITSYYDIELGPRKIPSDKSGIVSKNMYILSKDINAFFDNNDKERFDKTGTGRGQLWKYAGKYIIKNPIVGGGMECLKKYYSDNNITIDRPHNIILQVAAFIGIPGAIIYIILILYLAIGNLKFLKIDSIYFVIYVTAMCYFISSNFGNSMYYTSPYFMILLGFLISMKINNYKTKINI